MKERYKRVRVVQYRNGEAEETTHHDTLELAGKMVGLAAEAGGPVSWLMYPAPGHRIAVECCTGEVAVEYEAPNGTSTRMIPYSQVKSYLRGLCRWA